MDLIFEDAQEGKVKEHKRPVVIKYPVKVEQLTVIDLKIGSEEIVMNKK